MQHYDIIVIGSGPGGYTLAGYATAKGLKTAIVERDAAGGTCLNRGCIPTKCLCAGADRVLALKDAEQYGITGNFSASYATAHARIAPVVETLRQGVMESIADADFYHGEARLCDGHIVVVGTDMLKADKIVIATGSAPAPLRVEGAQYTINSDQFLALSDLPQTITIIGGGVIGLEIASIASAYGKNVTVVEYCREILPGVDSAIAKRLRTYMGRRGIKFHMQAQVTKIDADHTVHFTAKNKEQSVSSDMVIAAVGRRPVIPQGTKELGISLTDRGFIVTDDNFCTSVAGFYAIGDVNGRTMLAHAAEAQARVVAGIAKKVGNIPAVVFTNPECASVGLSADAIEGLESVSVPYTANAKAVAAGDTEGAMKIVYRPADYAILGAHAVGAHAAELVAIIAMAMDGHQSLMDIARDSVMAHPSLSEIIATAAEMAVKSAI